MLPIKHYFLVGAISGIMPFLLIGLTMLSGIKPTFIDNDNILPEYVFIPLFYGATNMIINVALYPYIGDTKYYYLVIGAIIGFIYASLGRFHYDLPENVWKQSNETILIISFVEWMLIYQLIIKKVDSNYIK